MRKGALVLMVVAVLAGAVPAGVAEAAAPRSAQRFADAVLRAKERIIAAEPAIGRGYKADFDACVAVANDTEDGPEMTAQTEDQVQALFIGGVLGPALEPTRGALDQLLADLDAIPTNDPVLRGGREAWRAEIAAVRNFPVLVRPCAQLKAWSDAGFTAATRPAVPFAAIAAYFEGTPALRRNARRLDAAAQRLQRLGISEGAARRFTGDSLYDHFWDGDEFGEGMPPRTRMISGEPD
ncbi:MAG TPA: hypothetical protein VN238_03230 [Solirubrobacteraceae bacterium]|nr:hypothetical protein [Solirubrobacteraceae bacterium]